MYDVTPLVLLACVGLAVWLEDRAGKKTDREGDSDGNGRRSDRW